MEKLYMVVIRWSAQRPELLDSVFSPAGDWFRYNPNTWLVWTEIGARDLAEMVRPKLWSTDSVVVARVDPHEIVGSAPTQMWDWLKPKIERNALTRGFRQPA
jgi:hypothetical protein